MKKDKKNKTFGGGSQSLVKWWRDRCGYEMKYIDVSKINEETSSFLKNMRMQNYRNVSSLLILYSHGLLSGVNSLGRTSTENR